MSWQRKFCGVHKNRLKAQNKYGFKKRGSFRVDKGCMDNESASIILMQSKKSCNTVSKKASIIQVLELQIRVITLIRRIKRKA